MSKIRLLAPLLTTVASLVLLAPAAGAAEPGHHCPGPFDAYTLEELVDLYESVGLSEEAAELLFSQVNHNGDSSVCVQDLTTERKPYLINVIDNNAH